MKTEKEIVDVVAGLSESYSSRMAALDTITDESIFKYLAENAEDDWIRLESAIRGGITPSLKTLENHPDQRISLEAAIELDDQQRLAELVLSSEDDLLKEIALNYIDDDERLMQIVENAGDDTTRVMAAFLLGDFTCCRKLITELKDESLILKMAQFLDDRQILEELSDTAGDKRIKEKAKEWLKNLEGSADEEID